MANSNFQEAHDLASMHWVAMVVKVGIDLHQVPTRDGHAIAETASSLQW